MFADTPVLKKPVLRRPKHVELGDPLQSQETLMRKSRIANPHDASDLNALKKSPSDEALPMQRWGRAQRISGKSRTGLCITVPAYNTFVNASLDSAALRSGATFEDKSILYMYTSSSSGGTRTNSSFGAIGDQLSSSKERSSQTNLLAPASAQSSQHQEIKANPQDLKNLVAESEVDRSIYQVVIAGETGPLARPSWPEAREPGELDMVPRRRRSLSDLIDRPIAIARPLNDEMYQDMVQRSLTDRTRSWHNRERPPEPPPVVWHRKGPSYREKVMQDITEDVYDPATFLLPAGSLVFRMKSERVEYLRHSVMTGVWSNRHGANNVLQTAWETKDPGARIVFLFSVKTSGNPNEGKFCGMAEMIGPYDPNGQTPYWGRFEETVRGAIRVQWLVTKDLPYSLFEDLQYKEQKVAQLRHANTIPAAMGRLTLQRYFEAPHGQAPCIHPQFGGRANPGIVYSTEPLQNHGATLPYHQMQSHWQQVPAAETRRSQRSRRGGFRASRRGQQTRGRGSRYLRAR